MSPSQALMALFNTNMRSPGADARAQPSQPAGAGDEFAGLLAAQLPAQLESVMQQLSPDQLASLEQAALAADGNNLPVELQDWLQQLPYENAPTAEDALAVIGQGMHLLQQDGSRPAAATLTGSEQLGAPGSAGREQPGMLVMADGESADALEAELQNRIATDRQAGREAGREMAADAGRMNLASGARQDGQFAGQSGQTVQQDFSALLQRSAGEPGPAAAALFGKLIEQMDSARGGRAEEADALDGINRAAAQSHAASAALTARPVAGAVQPDSVPFGHQNWGQSMVERVMWMSSQNLRSVEIQLDPAELGPLEIHIQNRGQELQVQFVSQNPGVREALEAQMHRLREMFAGQGLDQAEVTVADRSAGEQARQEQEQLAERGSAPAVGAGGTVDTAEAELSEQLVERATQPLRGLVDYYV